MSVPWDALDQKIKDEFLLDGKIELQHWYLDNTSGDRWPNTPNRKFSKEEVEAFKVESRNTDQCHETDRWLYNAFASFPIKGQTVVIVGSGRPKYEAIAMEYGAKVTTIDYNLTDYDDPDITQMTVEIYWKNPIQFDAAISVSSLEHDGLGRYGDPINPNGDIRAMTEMKQIIKKNGILYLTVPVAMEPKGVDVLVWNSNRIYGDIRLPMLLNGWEQLAFYQEGYTLEKYIEPVIVLKNS